MYIGIHTLAMNNLFQIKLLFSNFDKPYSCVYVYIHKYMNTQTYILGFSTVLICAK